MGHIIVGEQHEKPVADGTSIMVYTTTIKNNLTTLFPERYSPIN